MNGERGRDKRESWRAMIILYVIQLLAAVLVGAVGVFLHPVTGTIYVLCFFSLLGSCKSIQGVFKLLYKYPICFVCRFPCEHEFKFILSANCVFLLSSDEDMQSLASLMSMKQADIGNLDDFEEENEEDEENRVNQEEKAAKITGQD